MDIGPTVALTGITIVVMTLLALALLITVVSLAIRSIIGKAPADNSSKRSEAAVDTKAIEEKNEQPQEPVQTDASNDELIAVLTAAVLAGMNNRPECKIRVKSFRRIPEASPTWNLKGRYEQLLNKL